MPKANTVNNRSSQAVTGQLLGGDCHSRPDRESRKSILDSRFRGNDSIEVHNPPPITDPSAQAHVLLVDDEVSVLDISTFILQQKGYAVSMASNGQDALVMLNGSVNSSNPVDLVITDLTMPVMSGVDFIREMRKHDFLMPVVMATGCMESYSEPEIKNIGADHILLKPFNPADLTDCVKTILARKVMGQSQGGEMARREVAPYARLRSGCCRTTPRQAGPQLLSGVALAETDAEAIGIEFG